MLTVPASSGHFDLSSLDEIGVEKTIGFQAGRLPRDVVEDGKFEFQLNSRIFEILKH